MFQPQMCVCPLLVDCACAHSTKPHLIMLHYGPVQDTVQGTQGCAPPTLPQVSDDGASIAHSCPAGPSGSEVREDTFFHVGPISARYNIATPAGVAPAMPAADGGKHVLGACMPCAFL